MRWKLRRLNLFLSCSRILFPLMKFLPKRESLDGTFVNAKLTKHVRKCFVIWKCNETFKIKLIPFLKTIKIGRTCFSSLDHRVIHSTSAQTDAVTNSSKRHNFSRFFTALFPPTRNRKINTSFFITIVIHVSHLIH